MSLDHHALEAQRDEERHSECHEGTREECQAEKDEVSLEDFLDDEAEPCACACHDEHDGNGRTT